jgi:hypothetical protein
MRQLVLSLARLYKLEKITKDKLQEMVINQKITEEEYNYILSAE